jgi:cytochrome P450 family 142 subfamily A polypeptide 1
MLLRWSDDMLAATSMSAPPDALARAMRTFEEYAAYNHRVVADRRARPRDDMMSTLVHAEIDGQKLSDEDILQEGLLILVGGDETTRHVITGGMEALIRNPDERRKLHANPGLVPLAVEEMLRWVSPIKNMNRTATRDVELAGARIREGDKVLLLYPSANRDERAFPRADEFHVDRVPNDHVAFGHGVHFCLGASLARLELCIMFETLLARLPDLELATSAPLKLRPSNFIVGIDEMPVVFTPRA